jgi:hypothetical protein
LQNDATGEAIRVDDPRTAHLGGLSRASLGFRDASLFGGFGSRFGRFNSLFGRLGNLPDGLLK